MASVIARKRLWLTRDRERLVPDGHPDAAFLFCTPGREIPEAEAERLGLSVAEEAEEDTAEEAVDEDPEAPEAAEAKEEKGPIEDKSIAPRRRGRPQKASTKKK